MKITKTLTNDNTTPLSGSTFLNTLANQSRMSEGKEEIKKYKGFRYVVPETVNEDNWGTGGR